MVNPIDQVVNIKYVVDPAKPAWVTVNQVSPQSYPHLVFAPTIPVSGQAIKITLYLNSPSAGEDKYDFTVTVTFNSHPTIVEPSVNPKYHYQLGTASTDVSVGPF